MFLLFFVADVSSRASNCDYVVPEVFWYIRNDLPDCIEKDVFTEMAVKCGFQFSGDFQLIEKVWKSSHKALCRVKLTDSVKNSLSKYVLHPAIIDVCFQSCIPLLQKDDEDDAPALPVGFRRLTLIPVTDDIKEFYGLATKTSNISYDLRLLTDSGEVLLIIEDFKVVQYIHILRNKSVMQLYGLYVLRTHILK